MGHGYDTSSNMLHAKEIGNPIYNRLVSNFVHPPLRQDGGAPGQVGRATGPAVAVPLMLFNVT